MALSAVPAGESPPAYGSGGQVTLLGSANLTGKCSDGVHRENVDPPNSDHKPALDSAVPQQGIRHTM